MFFWRRIGKQIREPHPLRRAPGKADQGNAVGTLSRCDPFADHRNAPVNALGYLRVMFAVEDIDDTLARLRKCRAQLLGDVVQYEDTYRLCYIRGPEGILIGLAEELVERR